MKRLRSMIVLAALGTAAGSGLAAPRYHFTELGTLPGQSSSRATDINDAQIVTVITGPYSFVWDQGTITQLQSAHSSQSARAYSLNNGGQIVGRSRNAQGRYVTVTWSTDGAVTQDIGECPAQHELPDAYGITSSGHIAVTGYQGPNHWAQAYVFRDGAYVDIGRPPGWCDSRALGVNDLDQVVGHGSCLGGYGGFVWSSGAMTPLTPLTGHNQSAGYSINNGTVIAGFSGGYVNNVWEQVAVVWSDGQATALGGYPASTAYAINEAFDIVGTGYDGSTSAAVLWSGGGVFNLNDALIAPLPSGWSHLYDATSINNLGAIVGNGMFDPDGDPNTNNSVSRAFLLTPVPEPTTSLSLGLVILLGARRRR